MRSSLSRIQPAVCSRGGAYSKVRRHFERGRFSSSFGNMHGPSCSQNRGGSWLFFQGGLGFERHSQLHAISCWKSSNPVLRTMKKYELQNYDTAQTFHGRLLVSARHSARSSHRIKVGAVLGLATQTSPVLGKMSIKSSHFLSIVPHFPLWPLTSELGVVHFIEPRGRAGGEVWVARTASCRQVRGGSSGHCSQSLTYIGLTALNHDAVHVEA